MELVLGYIAAAFMGVTLGLIGAGGSILTVPILVFLIGIDPIEATAYSLFIVGLSAAFAAFQYGRKKMIDFPAAITFAIPSIITVFFTRLVVVPALPEVIYRNGSFTISDDQFILGLFTLVILIAAISMISKRNKPEESDESGIIEKTPAYYTKILLEGSVVGFLTGLVGAGGGFLIIPALVLLTRMPMKMAVGTSLLIIAAKSLIGFLGDVANQPLDWQFLMLFTSISITGILLGVFLSTMIDGSRLKKGFGFFLLAMAVIIAIDIF